MNRRRLDIIVAGLVGIILLGGGVLSWQAYQQQQAIQQTMGSMMDSSMGTIHGPNPIWYVFGTLLAAFLVGGGYLVFRAERIDSSQDEHPESDDSQSTESPPMDDEPGTIDDLNPESQPRERILDLLPEDERRILEPVLTSPGITQIELRDRSDFSKSKVSQTVSELEQRGLLYRERQGRTYRVYPSDSLQEERGDPS